MCVAGILLQNPIYKVQERPLSPQGSHRTTQLAQSDVQCLKGTSPRRCGKKTKKQKRKKKKKTKQNKNLKRFLNIYIYFFS